MKKWVFIVIDGTDWSWKRTQSNRLVEKYRSEWYEVEKIDFPQYGKPSAWPAEEYLNWKFWSADDVTPYQASILYAVDRFSAANTIRWWLNEGKIVIYPIVINSDLLGSLIIISKDNINNIVNTCKIINNIIKNYYE